MPEQGGLLTPEYEAYRLGAPIVQFAVKGDPRTPPGNPPLYKDRLPIVGELEAVQQCMLNPYDIHDECDGPGRLALVRKMSPHGMSEMTVMAQEGYGDDGSSVNSLFGFEPEVRRSFYGVGKAFAEFAEANDLYPIVSYTYDPLTNDRKSAQSVKTYHMQLIARSDEELAQMAEGARPLAEHDVQQRRQIIDEASVVYSLALTDYFTAYPVGSLAPIAPFSQDNCSNLRFRVGDSWNDIMTAEFDGSVRTIHEAMSMLYAEFEAAAMSGTTGHWERPELSPAKAYEYIDSLNWMQPRTKEVFKYFISGLRVSQLHEVDKLKATNMTAHVYPLAGLCYGTAINRNPEGDLMLSIRPQLFAETGGTGLQFIDPVGLHVKMARGTGKYDAEEVSAKAAFEQECAAYIVGSTEVA
jgi:cytochrome c556